MTALLQVEGVTKSWAGRCCRQSQRRGRGSRVLRPARPFRLRQDHLLRMIAGSEQLIRRILLDGEDITAMKTQSPADQPDVPVLRAVPAHVGLCQCRHGLEMGVMARSPSSGDRTKLWPWCSSPARPGASRISLRRPEAARWFWRARWCSSDRSCCCWMNPWARSTKAARAEIELKRLQQENRLPGRDHDQEEALTMADRIALLERGQNRAMGRSRPLRAAGQSCRSPISHRLTNFIEGHAKGIGLEVLARHSGRRQCRATVPEGVPAALAIRPERISLRPFRLPIPGRARSTVGLSRPGRHPPSSLGGDGTDPGCAPASLESALPSRRSRAGASIAPGPPNMHVCWSNKGQFVTAREL